MLLLEKEESTDNDFVVLGRPPYSRCLLHRCVDRLSRKAGRLAVLMVRCLDDPDFRESLIDKGATVLASYSMRDTAAIFQALYARVGQRSEVGQRLGKDVRTSVTEGD
jgi:hypothetical protein